MLPEKLLCHCDTKEATPLQVIATLPEKVAMYLHSRVSATGRIAEQYLGVPHKHE